MGDPPKLRKKYETPKRLWDADRLREEKGLKKSYGLKNMHELWLASAILKKYRREARRLLSLTEEERRDDAPKVLARLNRMGVLKEGAGLDDILSLSVRDILERRLQTIVVRKGLAYSMAQSRQLISHGFIRVGDRRVSIPSYFVFREDEDRLAHAKAIELKRPPAEAAEEPAEETAAEKPAEAPSAE